MERQPVNSSNIVSCGWDQETKILEVEFRNGVYQYPDCDADLYNNFLCAPSKGVFFAANIKKRPCQKM